MFVYGTLIKGLGNDWMMKQVNAKFVCEGITKNNYIMKVND